MPIHPMSQRLRFDLPPIGGGPERSSISIMSRVPVSSSMSTSFEPPSPLFSAFLAASNLASTAAYVKDTKSSKRQHEELSQMPSTFAGFDQLRL